MDNTNNNILENKLENDTKKRKILSDKEINTQEDKKQKIDSPVITVNAIGWFDSCGIFYDCRGMQYLPQFTT